MLPDSNTKSIETSENNAKKKTTSYYEQDPQVDETGIDKFMYRKYARAVKGEKVYGKIMVKKVIAPLQYKGMTNSQFFEEWFENTLFQS